MSGLASHSSGGRFIAILGGLAVAVALLASGSNSSPGGGTWTAASTYSLTGRQAQEVSVAVRFINAFNRRQLQGALALLSPDIGVSDCDYRRVEVVLFSGKIAVGRWLRQRFADRDQLKVARFYNENPEQPSGGVGVEYVRRTSLTLRALGFPHGIRPSGATKIVFTTGTDIRISKFANGPYGGPQEGCRPNGPSP